ncbi:MAG: hypothetical protein QM586_13765 [Xenophilus sp.]
MNRCLPRDRTPILLAAALLLAGAAPAQAQVQVQTQNEAAAGGRSFPVNTLRGRLVVTAFPEAALDDRPERLAPGVRIRDPQNMIIQPATITGQRLAVNYRRDPAGLVNEVWILTPAEAAAGRQAANTPFLDFWPFTTKAQNE